MKQSTINALKSVIRKMIKEEVKRQLNNEVAAKDVHHAAEEVGMEWDNDENFMEFSKSVTGKEHIDDMTSEERSKLISAIKTESVTKGETDDTEWYQGPDGHREIVKYTTDPVLNGILNETKGGIQGEPGMEPYPTMGDGVIDTQEKFFQQTGKAPIGNVGSQDDTPNFMKKAMSGHYKEIIDKVEETRGTRTK